MITFTLTGHLGQRLVRFMWTDGQVTSNSDWALFLLHEQAKALEGYRVRMPACMPTRHHHLSDQNSAYEIMQMVLTDVGRITAGALPQLRPLGPHEVA